MANERTRHGRKQGSWNWESSIQTRLSGAWEFPRITNEQLTWHLIGLELLISFGFHWKDSESLYHQLANQLAARISSARFPPKQKTSNSINSQADSINVHYMSIHRSVKGNILLRLLRQWVRRLPQRHKGLQLEKSATDLMIRLYWRLLPNPHQ